MQSIHVTQHLSVSDPNNIVQTAVFLKQGHLVVIPTDTVYGLTADAFNETAVLQLYAAKGRPAQKSIPVLLADVSDILRVARYIPPLAQTYIEQFWPGPLTMVVPKNKELPTAVSADDTVAIRIPNHAIARAVIRAAGGAVAVTSANRSGQPPATTAQQAIQSLAGWITAVLDDGLSPGEIASTVVDCTNQHPRILRQGPITPQDLGITI